MQDTRVPLDLCKGGTHTPNQATTWGFSKVGRWRPLDSVTSGRRINATPGFRRAAAAASAAGVPADQLPSEKRDSRVVGSAHGKGKSTKAGEADSRQAGRPRICRPSIPRSRRCHRGSQGCSRSRATGLGWPQNRFRTPTHLCKRCGTPGRPPGPSMVYRLEHSGARGGQAAGRLCGS
jgi:hypothetical protein